MLMCLARMHHLSLDVWGFMLSYLSEWFPMVVTSIEY